MQLAVVVWHGLGRDTPRTPADRADFAAYAGALVQALPQLRYVIVGNEPNLSTFWKPQFGAGGSDLAAREYADLLARSYDAVKAARPNVLVLGGALSPRGADRPGGSRPTHSPTAFIRDLGAAYRASGRHKPLMDAFAIHPYMEASEDSPERRAPGEHDDHDRRLSEAGLPARPGLPRHRPTGRAAPDLLHGVRRPDRRADREAPVLLEPRLAERGPTASRSGRRPPTTGARSSSPTASRPSAACSSSTPSTSPASAAGSRGSTSPTARRSRACRPSSGPSATCATASCRAALARLSRVAGQYVAYTFFRVDPAWRRLPIDERARRQGRLRRSGRGLRRPHVLAARLLDYRRAARRRTSSSGRSPSATRTSASSARR